MLEKTQLYVVRSRLRHLEDNEAALLLSCAYLKAIKKD